MTIGFRVYFVALLLLAASLLQVARCQSEPDPDLDIADPAEGDIGLVDEDVHDLVEETFNAAPGIETITVFPKNVGKLVTAGEETELLVGLKNNGESTFNVIAIKASVHLPYDHRMLVQNLTAQGFNNATVPVSAQATFPYVFAVSKYLQAGTFDLVGTIIYEIDQSPYQSTFYNGTVEVVESGNLFSVESVFLVTLGIALLIFLGVWVRGQIQQLSKKSKRAAKVEVGTKTTDASMDEWLQGTAYTQSLSSKSKKKK
uniref:Translocon-associated protein subunit alpha n=1 Tax=Kalanchoe fedtschenkoi TaxID=63787 RepID=A0A7N0TDM0_KALFE